MPTKSISFSKVHYFEGDNFFSRLILRTEIIILDVFFYMVNLTIRNEFEGKKHSIGKQINKRNLEKEKQSWLTKHITRLCRSNDSIIADLTCVLELICYTIRSIIFFGFNNQSIIYEIHTNTHTYIDINVLKNWCSKMHSISKFIHTEYFIFSMFFSYIN